MEFQRNLFFKEIEMTYGNFKGEARKRSLNSDAIEKILTIYSEINAHWLITGKGEMIKPEIRIETTGLTVQERCNNIEGNNLSDRVRSVLLHFQLNSQKVGDSTGKASNTFRNIINGKTTDVKISTVISLLDMVPAVDARWLLTGTGNMIREYAYEKRNKIAAEPQDNYRCQACSKKDGEIKALTQYNQMLSEKSDKQQEEIGKLRQQLEELKGRGNNRNSKQAG